MDNNLSSTFTFEDASGPDGSTEFTPSYNEYSSNYTYPVVDTERVKLIWGTTINIQETMELFRNFLDQNRERIERLCLLEEGYLDVVAEEGILSEKIVDQLEKYPTEIIPVLEDAFREFLVERDPSWERKVELRFFGCGSSLDIRNIDNRLIDRMVVLEGMVLRVSSPMPELLSASYRCTKCGHVMSVECVKGIVAEPVECGMCSAKFTMMLKTGHSEFLDKQILKVQELPENIMDMPMSMVVVLREQMLDVCVPGDRIKITGILKASPVRLNQHMKTAKTIFRTFVEALGVEKIHEKKAPKEKLKLLKEGENFEEEKILEEVEKKSKVAEGLENLNEILNEEEEKVFESLVENKDEAYEILSSSIAPSIFGMADVKKALLLMLAGGVQKNLETVKLRGSINILLAGDPGVAKSQLLDFINRLSSRGMYTSGRGSSAVGLTANVTRDVDTRQYVLESGALVLSDGGICCIDEFDKMTDSTRSVLHEAMEQQTISVAKAGIITSLNARCSILASCNPIESKYNIKKSIAENINLPPTLLSRFDLIFLLIDKPDEEEDRRIGEHILSMMVPEKENLATPVRVLKKYLSRASGLAPRLTEEAMNELKHSYCSLRQLNSGRTVTATTRQLESLIRLSEAHARVRLSSFVEKKDVYEAVRLVRESLLTYAIDPETGKVDMDLVMSGRSQSRRKRVEELKKEIVKMKKKMRMSELVRMFRSECVHEAIEELKREGEIIEDGKGGVECVKDLN